MELLPNTQYSFAEKRFHFAENFGTDQIAEAAVDDKPKKCLNTLKNKYCST